MFTYLTGGVLTHPSEHSNSASPSTALQTFQPFHLRGNGSREYFRALFG